MDCSPPGFSIHGIFPSKSTGVGCHFLLQGIFPTQGLNLGLPALQADALTSELPEVSQRLYPLQYPCLENPMDRVAWQAAVRGVAEGRTRLSDFTCTSHFPALEKKMATHSSVLAWRIPGTGEPGRLPSVGLHRVGHD